MFWFNVSAFASICALFLGVAWKLDHGWGDRLWKWSVFDNQGRTRAWVAKGWSADEGFFW